MTLPLTVGWFAHRQVPPTELGSVQNLGCFDARGQVDLRAFPPKRGVQRLCLLDLVLQRARTLRELCAGSDEGLLVSMRERPGDRSRPCVHLKLVIGVLEMLADGVRRDEEKRGDFLVRLP